MKLLYIGGGYVGACSAAANADSGHNVLVYDINQELIRKLSSFDKETIETAIYEEGLGDFIIKNRDRIAFTDDLSAARRFVDEADAVFMCLPTPEKDGSGETDLSFYEKACHDLARILVARNNGRQDKYILIVNRSTVPIDVFDWLKNIFDGYNVVNYGIAANPEFLVEGSAIKSLTKPDRIVAGAWNEKDFMILRDIYKRFSESSTDVAYIEVNPCEAAAAKLLANYMLFNRLANCFDVVGRLCEKNDGLRFEKIRKVLVSDKRIGNWGFHNSLFAGGSCFIKDSRSLAHHLSRQGDAADLVKNTLEANSRQLIKFLARAEAELSYDWRGKRVGLLGLAFKRDTNDIRNSAAIGVTEFLLRRGVGLIKAYDPAAGENYLKYFSGENKAEKIEIAGHENEVMEQVDVLIVVTDWPQFRELSGEIIKNLPKGSLIMDGRRILQTKYGELSAAGYNIIAVGSPLIKARALFTDKKIGFIGQGWIGRNYADNFEQRGYNVVRYGLEEPYAGNAGLIKECDIVFVAVPTPTTPKGFDSGILRNVMKLIGAGKIAVIKSTVPPGMTESIQNENPEIYVMHSPEFLSRHTAAYDAANPNRNIIGIPRDTPEHRQKAEEVMAVLPKAPYGIICPAKDAELVKYGGNCFFYFKNIFMNMLYDVAQKYGCDWENVREMVAADPRIGKEHTRPINKGGRGAGGDCLIKDFEAFLMIYKSLLNDGAGVRILESIRNKNIKYLIDSGKDLDLVKGVYGEDAAKLIYSAMGEAGDDSIAPAGGRAGNIAAPKCLVTGGAGFIGSNLIDELISRGHKVVVIDNLSGGKKENVNPAAEFYQLDIRDLEAIKPLFAGVDYVFHLAAVTNIQFSIDNPIESNDINLNGTFNVLMAARDAKVKKVVYSASSSAYGLQDELPWRENMQAKPLSPYSVQKYVGELYCRSFYLIYGLPTVSLRYFNVYGKRQKLEGAYAPVMGIFARQRIQGRPMTIFGDGEQSRDFTSVDDVVRANILAAESGKVGKGEVINIGRGKSFTVNELARMIGGPVEYLPPRIEVKGSLADNSLARELLGWEPTINLPEWLEEYKKEMEL